MSRLSDFQIKAMIEGIEKTLNRYGAEGKASLPAARKCRQKLAAYRLELADRAAGRAVQEPQADHRKDS